ncbi:hypothetical protein VP758_005272, partial [Vibrio harveyi]|nr:hypothetical protein [Vibrio harveyi]
VTAKGIRSGDFSIRVQANGSTLTTQKIEVVADKTTARPVIVSTPYKKSPTRRSGISDTAPPYVEIRAKIVDANNNLVKGAQVYAGIYNTSGGNLTGVRILSPYQANVTGKEYYHTFNTNDGFVYFKFGATQPHGHIHAVIRATDNSDTAQREVLVTNLSIYSMNSLILGDWEFTGPLKWDFLQVATHTYPVNGETGAAQVLYGVCENICPALSNVTPGRQWMMPPEAAFAVLASNLGSPASAPSWWDKGINWAYSSSTPGSLVGKYKIYSRKSFSFAGEYFYGQENQVNFCMCARKHN